MSNKKYDVSENDSEKRFVQDDDRDKELSLSLQIQAYLNTASDELYASGKPLCSEKRIKDIHKCMLMWKKLHDSYFHHIYTWSEEDEVMLDEIIDFFENGTVKLQHDLSLYASWLKSLKDRVQPQPKQEWSEDDEEILNLIIARLHSHPNVEFEEYSKEYNWLKSHFTQFF